MALQFKFSPDFKAMLAVRPPVRIKILRIKERHLKRLEELSLKSSKEKPQIEEPTEEQEKWYEGKMKAPARAWRTWDEEEEK